VQLNLRALGKGVLGMCAVVQSFKERTLLVSVLQGYGLELDDTQMLIVLVLKASFADSGLQPRLPLTIFTLPNR
jgi:hypothetical protein